MIDADCRGYFDLLNRSILQTEATTIESKVSDPISVVVEMLREVKAFGSKVIFVGNGGSLSACSHFANDLCLAGVAAIALDSVVNATCAGNDFGFEEVFAKQYSWFAKPGDVLIALSCSGMSRNVLRVARESQKVSNLIITFSGFEKDNMLRVIGDLNFWVPSKSYGIVQLAHEAILHCIVDTVSGLR